MGERGGTELEIDRYPSYQLPKANDDHPTLVPTTKNCLSQNWGGRDVLSDFNFPIFP